MFSLILELLKLAGKAVFVIIFIGLFCVILDLVFRIVRKVFYK